MTDYQNLILESTVQWDDILIRRRHANVPHRFRATTHDLINECLQAAAAPYEDSRHARVGTALWR